MNIKKIIVVLSLTVLSIGSAYNAYLSPYLGYHYMDQTRDLDHAWEVGAYYTDQLSENLFMDYNLGFVFSKVTSLGESKLLLGGGANALYAFPNNSIITPYLLGGIGGIGGYNAKLGLDIGFGCFIKLAPNFQPRLEVKNIYYFNEFKNDTIYQIIFAMPLTKPEVKEPVKTPIIPEFKEPPKTSYKNELEEAFMKTGKVEKLNMKINFDSGSSVVKPTYTQSLQKYAEFLMDHPEIKLSIKGYTDGQGGRDYNKKLSELRAKAVANVLIYKYGISKTRITALGLGGANPVATNNTETGRAQNRRIEASTF